MRPQAHEHPNYYGQYIALVKEDNIRSALAETKKTFLAFLRSIDPKLENHAYAEGKWTVKEVILHCTDTERIFSARALGYARGEKQKSLSYDENDYAKNCDAHTRSLNDLIEEYEAVANATTALFNSFSEKALASVGETPAGTATVLSVGFSMCGHNLHHMNILKERYL